MSPSTSRRAPRAPQLDPLPALFIVVDEFSELLSQKPDFAELFVMIGRLGRSLHMHLLLASQRLEEGKLRGLDSPPVLPHRPEDVLGQRVAQRCSVSPTPTTCPACPVRRYLKCDADDPLAFQRLLRLGTVCLAAVRPRRSAAAAAPVGQVPLVFTAAEVEAPALPPSRRKRPGRADCPALPPPPGRSVRSSRTAELRRRVEGGVPDDPARNGGRRRLRGHGRPAHEVWLPPLDESPSVDMLLPDPDWQSPVNRHGRLWMPIGVIDKPYDQRRDVLMVDLSRRTGQSGRGRWPAVG